jgi:oligoendopeptidase F
MGELNRNEVPNEYKWKLESIYVTDESWQSDYNLIDAEIPNITKYANHLLDNASTLLSFLELSDKLSIILEKMYVYAKMRSDEDTANNYYQAMVGKIENLNTKIGVVTSFVTPELLKGDYSTVLDYIKSNKGLEKYDFYLEKLYESKEHILSEAEETILSNFNIVFNSPSNTASLLRNADLKFDHIMVDDKEIELNNSNYAIYLSSSNRDVRKQAFDSMYKGYKSVKNTLSSTFTSEVNKTVIYSKIRHYKNALDMELSPIHVDRAIYDNLIDTVHQNLDKAYEYFKLRKETLKLDELHMYDLYTDMVSAVDVKYTYEDAKKYVIDALSILGDEYINDAKAAFTDGWIDVIHNRGKRSGAYSWGSYATNPFILLNYQEQLEDVSTLAHELGHSMHSYYSHKFNEYIDSHYEIFVAEVASTVNELLIYNYMLKHVTTDAEKLKILNELLELYKGTIYRQTMFAEFEKIIYESVESGEVLTEELISSIYLELNKKYFKDNVVVDSDIMYEWLRIPHFYTPFYVYQYATGLSAACHITKKILEGDKQAINNYLDFLKSGGSDYPVNLLKIAGIDMTKKETVESALNMFSDTLNEFKKIYNKQHD